MTTPQATVVRLLHDMNITLQDIINEELVSGIKHHPTRSIYSQAILNLLEKSDGIPDNDGWIYVGCIWEEFCKLKGIPFKEKVIIHWTSVKKLRLWKSKIV